MSFSSTDEYQKFETLFKQYYSGLVVYASRFTGNTENAEDFFLIFIPDFQVIQIVQTTVADRCK